MSEVEPGVTPEPGTVAQPGGVDEILQATCEAILTAVAEALDKEVPEQLANLRLPDGPVVGKQMTIDATEKDGLLNICRLAMLDVAQSPAGEAARIEYEHDKQTKYGLMRVYSIQSVRRQGDHLVLLENFLADKPAAVREEDFRPIVSEAYAKDSVLKTVTDWTRYRAWQLQEMGRRK